MVKSKGNRTLTTDKIDSLVYNAVFGTDEERKAQQKAVRDMAPKHGVFPASIQGLYDAAGKGLYHGVTVPAMNLRGLTYDVSRAVFRAAMKLQAGAFTFEIARSETGYTDQRPGEYTACVLAAAMREGFAGPVFIQGDHFQVSSKKYRQDPAKELEAIRELIREAIEAGFLNIDIDASTLVNITKENLAEQQTDNCQVTAEMTRFIRTLEPKRVTISVGGEIGEVGKRNSTVEDLKAFMGGYQKRLDQNIKGISKLSVQTGTSHGGVVLPDGSIAQVEIDFKTLEELGHVARDEYGLAGAVQHGASTLPDEAFDMFARVGCAEIHLATGFQNIIYDSLYFPHELKDEIYQYLAKHHQDERVPEDTDQQFFYKTRKHGFGPFKKRMWDMPRENIDKICNTLENRFALMFRKLNVADTVDLVKKYTVPQS